ncbi:MAG: hypothetical protein FWE25_08270 [Lachnospiraceae bacterium]|nr:hypothetical protein [Lachnospiraceae bacterium]
MHESSKWGDVQDAMKKTTLGRNATFQIGRECRCIVKVGRRSLFNLDVLDRHLNEMLRQQQGD